MQWKEKPNQSEHVNADESLTTLPLVIIISAVAGVEDCKKLSRYLEMKTALVVD